MALTAKGTPYVVSTDLVANYPTVSSDLADHIDDKLAYNAVTINAQTGSGANAYTFALADASEGKLVTASNAAAATYTIPPQSSVTWADGAVLRILNQGAGVVTIAAGAGVTINGTPLTLAQYKGAALQRTASNTWTIIPFVGGAGNAVLSNTPTGSYTSGGTTYNFYTFDNSGTATVTQAGLASVLVIGGGGGGGGNNASNNSGGGGAGGYISIDSYFLPEGSLTVTVGAGGANSTIGNNSVLGALTATGGGKGSDTTGGDGGSGGGGGATGGSGAAGGVQSIAQGFQGGSGTGTDPFPGGGGGGAGERGNADGNGSGGDGISSSITNVATTRAGGGSGARSGTANTVIPGGDGGGGAGGLASPATNPVAGTANTGGGGGGASGNVNGAAGGSGVVIIRVAV